MYTRESRNGNRSACINRIEAQPRSLGSATAMKRLLRRAHQHHRDAHVTAYFAGFSPGTSGTGPSPRSSDLRALSAVSRGVARMLSASAERCLATVHWGIDSITPPAARLPLVEWTRVSQ